MARKRNPLRLVPDYVPGPEDEPKGESTQDSNIVTIESEPDDLRLILSKFEAKHKAHIADVEAKKEAEKEAAILRLEMEAREKEAATLRAELERLMTHRTEGYSIRAELESNPTPSLVQRYQNWFKQNPLECALVTLGAAYALYKISEHLFDVFITARQETMKRDLDRELGKLDYRIEQINANPRIIESEVTNVHNHYPVNERVIEKAIPVRGPRGDRGQRGGMGPRGGPGRKGEKGDKGNPGRDATQEMVNRAVGNYLSKTGITFT